MALKEYMWRGHTYQIADEDLCRYPGAVPKPPKREPRAPKGTGRKVSTPKSGAKPLDKSAEPAADKRRSPRRKSGE